MHKGIYTDAFILHEQTKKDPSQRQEALAKRAQYGSNFSLGGEDLEAEEENPTDLTDPRRVLNNTWSKLYKYQPLWKIRNYFGEKIGFYFAWAGTMINTLWLPTIIGFGVFIYGLYLR